MLVRIQCLPDRFDADDPLARDSGVQLAQRRLDTVDEALHFLVRQCSLGHMAECTVEMIAHRKHVAGKAGYRIGRSLLLLRFQPAAHVLRLCVGVKRLVIGFLKLPLQVRDAVMLGQLRRTRRGFIPNVFGFLVQVFFVHHLINLVRACAVKSTMGTTRA